MSNKVKLYTIAFVDRESGVVAQMSIMEYFKKIEKILAYNSINIIREVNGKIMRVHAYEWDQSHNMLAIPIGMLKTKNKPLLNDDKTNKLIDIPQKMYDVNTIAYHESYNVLLITSNKEGPKENHIEDYLNSFLNQNGSVKIEIKPLKRNIGLENIRGAEQARSLSISLNLTKQTNQILKTEMHEEGSIASNLKQIINTSKNTMQSKVFKLELGLGKDRKTTLNISALAEILESLNLDSECISEIKVRYRGKKEKKIDLAKLRNNELVISLDFPTQESRMGAEYILNNMNDVLTSNRMLFYKPVEEYFQNIKEMGDDYEIIEEFENVHV